MSKLQQLRHKRRLTQADLIKYTGVSKSSILKYEIGANSINKASGETLLKLATVLGCQIEDILEDVESIKFSVYKEMYEKWRNEKEEQKKIANFITFSWKASEKASRLDFSNFCALDTEIAFEEMLKFEESYEAEHNFEKNEE